MKKTKLFLVQLFLLLAVAVYAFCLHNMRNGEYLEAGTFADTRKNTDLSDLADVFCGYFC